MRLIVVLFIGLASGCACVDERVEVGARPVVHDIRETGDLQLANAFKNGKLSEAYNLSWQKDSIEVMSYLGLYVPQTIDTISRYQNDKAAHDDRVVQIYREAVASRGNTLKTYGPAANEAIVGCFKQSPQADIYRRFDLDNALVEYDGDGNMVSAMVRIHRFSRNMVTDDHFVISKIYTGRLVRNIERDLKDFNFSNNLVASK